MIAGLFYGVSFGLGALSAALMGELADITSMTHRLQACAPSCRCSDSSPWFLPKIERPRNPLIAASASTGNDG
jgi:FSR family fosmidomycin resistance protein-like MFS transporter